MWWRSASGDRRDADITQLTILTALEKLRGKQAHLKDAMRASPYFDLQMG